MAYDESVHGRAHFLFIQLGNSFPIMTIGVFMSFERELIISMKDVYYFPSSCICTSLSECSLNCNFLIANEVSLAIYFVTDLAFHYVNIVKYFKSLVCHCVISYIYYLVFYVNLFEFVFTNVSWIT